MSDYLSRTDARRLQRQVQNMISRGVITDVNDAMMMQLNSVRLEDGHRPTQVEHWHPYGMTFHPHAEAEVLAFALKGNRDHVVIMPGADRRYRLKNLAEGELAVHDDQGQKVHFLRGGILVESALGITLKGPVTVLGDITQTGSINSTGVHHASAHT